MMALLFFPLAELPPLLSMLCHRLNLDLSFINPDDFRLFSYQPPPGPDHVLDLILMQTCLALQGLDFFF